jgi:hypothetical protein
MWELGYRKQQQQNACSSILTALGATQIQLLLFVITKGTLPDRHLWYLLSQRRFRADSARSGFQRPVASLYTVLCYFSPELFEFTAYSSAFRLEVFWKINTNKTIKLNSSVFRVIMRREVVWNRRFGSSYLSHLQGSSFLESLIIDNNVTIWQTTM